MGQYRGKLIHFIQETKEETKMSFKEWLIIGIIIGVLLGWLEHWYINSGNDDDEN